MSNEFDDAINDLFSLIHENDDAVNYLRSASAKLLFAQNRLNSLQKNIDDYKNDQEIRATIGTLNIEMDFDHCISSLRSSIEHLLQLLNIVADLKLFSLRTSGENIVTIGKVAGRLSEKDSSELKEIAEIINKVINSSWYKDLHELRIILFHDKVGRFSRSVNIDMSQGLSIIDFRLPPGTAPKTSGDNARLIDVYCKARTNNIEEMLFDCFKLLIKYLKVLKGYS
jgi:hypothetical protein